VLDRKRSRAAAEHLQLAVMLGNETVLVVEDDRTVQATVVEMLSGLGYRVLRADSPQAALTVVSSGVHIDLLFTDVVMPGQISSVEMVRQAQSAMPTLKVLFTSGYTQNAIVHGGRLDVGVELLSKPYGRDELARKIRHVLGVPGVPDLAALAPLATAAAPVPPAEADESSRSLHVLVVDDDMGSLDAVAEILRLLGHEPHKSPDAKQALDALANTPFDVLLTDVRLPDMSGIVLARRALQANGKLRVIFASGEPIKISESLPCDYRAIHKPFSVDDLKKSLHM
jgi:CheY-like chemotaxis protein